MKHKIFGKFLDGGILACLFALVLVAVSSIGFQSLLIWIGGLFPSVAGLGVAIDALIGLLLVMPLFIGACLSSDNETDADVILSLLSVAGIYLCIVFGLAGCCSVFVYSYCG